MDAVNPSNIKALSDAIGPSVVAVLALIGFFTFAVIWLMKQSKNLPAQHQNDDQAMAAQIMQKIDALTEEVREIKTQMMVREERDKLVQLEFKHINERIAAIDRQPLKAV